MKFYYLSILLVFFSVSCASKKEVLYMQDAERVAEAEVQYTSAKIQPNDILKILSRDYLGLSD